MLLAECFHQEEVSEVNEYLHNVDSFLGYQ